MTEQIFPCLWMDSQAREAADYYCSIFPNSKIISANPMVVYFELNGSKYMALNGGPLFTFNESVSFVIMCKDQEEIDYYWDALTREGKEGNCGWLKDKCGVSWQVVPSVLAELMSKPEKSGAVVQAFMKMKKFDIQKLMEA